MRVTIKKFMIAFRMEVVMMHNKYLLSIKEASHLMIGRVIKIKRESFEEFISKVEQI